MLDLLLNAFTARAHDERQAGINGSLSRMDWRQRTILTKLAEGFTYPESASAAGVSRISVWHWCKSSPEFRNAVALARDTGKDERTFRLWLRHPRRGLRPQPGAATMGNLVSLTDDGDIDGAASYPDQYPQLSCRTGSRFRSWREDCHLGR